MKKVYACAFCAAVAATALATVEYSYEGDDGKTYVANVTSSETAISSEALAVLDANVITNFVKRGSADFVVDTGSVYTGDVHLEDGRICVKAANALGVGPGKFYAAQKKIVMNGGSIAKNVVFDCGSGWNSNTGIALKEGDSAFGGKVTFTDKNFYMYLWGGSRLVFEAGLEGPGYLYLREGNGGMIVFTNVAASLTKPISIQDGARLATGGYCMHIEFAVAGNSLNAVGNSNSQANRLTGCKLTTTVDWAFDNTNQRMNFGAGSLWDLCGTSQRVGYLDANRLENKGAQGPMSVITNSSATAAALYVTQTANATPAVVFAGDLSVSFSGNCTTTIDHAMPATGDVTVNAGTLAFTEDGSWRGAAKVTVENGAAVTIASGDTFGDGTEIALNGTGNLSIAAGEGGTVVTQTVGFLTAGGIAQARGFYTMGSGVLEVLHSGRCDIANGTLELAAGESFTLDDSILCDTFDKITLGAGASLTILTDAYFAEGASFTLALGAGATLDLADGIDLYAESVTVGGAAVASGRHSSASDSWLTGDGDVFIPYGAIAGTDVAWTAEGANALMTTAGNWATAPDLANGTARAVFAAGTEAVVTGEKFLNGLLFGTDGAFSVAASGEGALLRLASGGMATSETGPYAISSPIRIDGDQTWNIEKELTIDGGITSDPLARYTIHKTGSKALTVNGPGDFAGTVSIDGSSIIVSGTDPLGTSGTIVINQGSSLILAGATVNKPVQVDPAGGWGNVTGFSVYGDRAASEVKGKVTFATGNFNTYIYSNGSNRGRLTFSGGLEGSGGYPYFYLNGGGATGTGYSTLVITNQPFNFGTDRGFILVPQSINRDGIACEIVLSVPGNVCSAFGHMTYHASHCNLYTTVDGVFANPAMKVICDNNFKWDLCGTTQSTGPFTSYHTADNPPTVTNSSETAATLAISQTATADSKVMFGGKLNVDFAVGKGKTLTISDAMTAEGTLSVSGGTLALAAGGSWRGATEVTVSGGGKLTVAEPRALGKQAALALESAASLEIASGVTVRVDGLTVGGVARANGSYMFGSGTLAVGRKGMVISFR